MAVASWSFAAVLSAITVLLHRPLLRQAAAEVDPLAERRDRIAATRQR